GRKLSIGLSPHVIDRLPKGWPRHTRFLEAYIRETRVCEDVELLWSNDLDALLLGDQTRHSGLYEQEVYASNTSGPLFFVTRPGLARCRQSRAVIEELER
ncbi:MAG: hypothetical protein AAGC81_04270, partial [Pseudomonadota bacterium]